MTKLEELGLDKTAIMNGDEAEFSPVDKKDRRNKAIDLYNGEVVDKVISAVFTDLRDAYDTIDKLTNERNQAQDQVNQYKDQLNRMTTYVNKQGNMEQSLKKSMSDVTHLSGQLTTLQTEIKNTKVQLDNANKSRDDIQSKLNDIQTQSEALRREKQDAENKVNELSANLETANKQLKDYDQRQTQLAESITTVINSLSDRYGEFLDKIDKDKKRLANVTTGSNDANVDLNDPSAGFDANSFMDENIQDNLPNNSLPE